MADHGVGTEDDIARLSLGRDDRSPTPPSPPPPNIRGSGIVVTDITSKFAGAVATLSPGEIVKDEFFTLFDSVAALEIGDPKMDSVCADAGDDDPEELYDVSRPLCPDEVLGIIDQLLCHEMSWHLGYPLSQTLFTSLYVEALLMPAPANMGEAKFVRQRHHDDANEQPMLQVLRAYCLGMLKACGYVNERIKSEHYYEEEDFVTNTYNRSLLSKIPADEIQQVLADAQDVVTSQRSVLGDEMANALSDRLHLRRVFLAAAESVQHIKDAEKAGAPWDEALELLPRLSLTHSLARPVEDAFSAKLQRKLASTMPPRPIVRLDFEKAFGHLSRLFQDGLEVIGALDYEDSQCLQTFVTLFQAKNPQPLVYIRTLLQTFLFNAMEVLGSMSIRQLLDDDFSIITLPANVLLDRANDEIEATQDARHVMSQQMEAFRQRAAQPFLDIFRTACQNRCRVRRTLCHMIGEWEGLQVDAEDIDQLLQKTTQERPLMQRLGPGDEESIEAYSLPLSSWTHLYKVRQMELVVQLGFELEIYQPHELAGMYWHLNHLVRFRHRHVERIKSFVVDAIEQARSRWALQRGIPEAARQQLRRSLAHSQLCILDAAVTWELSDALCCLYIALSRIGAVRTPAQPYSNDELRYALRMKPFADIAFPPAPTFDEFREGITREGTTTAELLSRGGQAAGEAKKGLEALSRLSAADSFSVGSHERWVAKIKGALRASIATGIAISFVQKALLQQQQQQQQQKTVEGEDLAAVVKAEIPTPDQAYHEWWIVPKLSAAS